MVTIVQIVEKVNTKNLSIKEGFFYFFPLLITYKLWYTIKDFWGELWIK